MAQTSPRSVDNPRDLEHYDGRLKNYPSSVFPRQWLALLLGAMLLALDQITNGAPVGQKGCKKGLVRVAEGARIEHSPDPAGEIVKSCGRRVLIDHAATLFSASSVRSMSIPFSNVAPARTRATRCGPLT